MLSALNRHPDARQPTFLPLPSASTPMKKKVMTLVQIIVTLAVLAWLFRSPETRQQVLEGLKQVSPLWLLGSFIAFGIMRALAMVRWQILLRVQGVNISWWRASALTMIGLFFNIFLPGGAGGDVVKGVYLLKEPVVTPDKQAPALLSILMDRVVGLVMMFFLAGIVLIFRYDWLMQTPATSDLMLAMGVIAAGSFGLIGGSYLLSALGWVEKLPARFPMRRKLTELSKAYTLYGRAWKPLVATLILSIAVHLFSFAQFYCVALGLGGLASSVNLPDFFSVMPVIATLTAVPISLGGTGVREGLFVQLLGDLCGVAKAYAMVISILGFFVQVLWGALGGLVYLFYRPTAAPSPRE